MIVASGVKIERNWFRFTAASYQSALAWRRQLEAAVVHVFCASYHWIWSEFEANWQQAAVVGTCACQPTMNLVPIYNWATLPSRPSLWTVIVGWIFPVAGERQGVARCAPWRHIHAKQPLIYYRPLYYGITRNMLPRYNWLWFRYI